METILKNSKRVKRINIAKKDYNKEMIRQLRKKLNKKDIICIVQLTSLYFDYFY